MNGIGLNPVTLSYGEKYRISNPWSSGGVSIGSFRKNKLLFNKYLHVFLQLPVVRELVGVRASRP